MPVELKITGEDSTEVMTHVRDFAGAANATPNPDMGPAGDATPDPAEGEPKPGPGAEPEQKQPAKKSGGAKKSSGGSRQKSSGGSKKKQPEPEPEEDSESKTVSFEDLTEAANKFIQAMSGEMRKAQDMVQEAFGVRKISQLGEDQYGDAHRWLLEQAEKALAEDDDED